MQKIYVVNTRENVVVAKDYTNGNGMEEFKSVFFRKENAQHALALMRAYEDLVAKDREQHGADLKEDKAYQDEQEQKRNMITDIITDGVGRVEKSFSGEFLKMVGAIIGIPVERHGFMPGVIVLSPSLALIQSDRDEDKYYPVTKTSCGCPDHVYRKHACKHMRHMRDILGE